MPNLGEALHKTAVNGGCPFDAVWCTGVGGGSDRPTRARLWRLQMILAVIRDNRTVLPKAACSCAVTRMNALKAEVLAEIYWRVADLRSENGSWPP